MLPPEYYSTALLNKTPPAGGPTDTGGKFSPSNPSPNFAYTKDPNVNVGKYGVKITKDDMAKANKNGMAWDDFNEFSHWLGGFAHNTPDYGSVSPYYRTYPGGKINGADIAVLMAKGDPKVNEIIGRNIAKPGEVPLFGAEDSSALNQLIAAQRASYAGPDYSSLVKPK